MKKGLRSLIGLSCIFMFLIFTAQDGCCLFEDSNDPIAVGMNVYFDADPLEGCAPLDVTFTVTVSHPISSIKSAVIDIDGDTTTTNTDLKNDMQADASGNRNVSISVGHYPSPGVYVAKLIVVPSTAAGTPVQGNAIFYMDSYVVKTITVLDCDTTSDSTDTDTSSQDTTSTDTCNCGSYTDTTDCTCGLDSCSCVADTTSTDPCTACGGSCTCGPGCTCPY